MTGGKWWGSKVGRRVVALGLALLASACAVDDRPDGLADSSSVGASVDFDTTPCDDAATRHCSITIDQANGVVSCFEGTQVCSDGRWGGCENGEVSRRPDPTDASVRRSFGFDTEALSGTPVACINNPCDPTCFNWFEDGQLSSTVSGSLPAYPGLPAQNACVHDTCTNGVALPATCSSCATTVCATDPACCTTAWDDRCVEEAYQLCANSTAPLGLCDFGLFSTGILRTAGPLTGNVAVGALSNVDIGVGSQVRRIVSQGSVTITNGSGPSNPLVGIDGILAAGNVDVQAGTSRVGPINAGGRVWLASHVDVLGSVYAQTNVEGQLTARVLGSAWAHGTIDGNLAVLQVKYPGSSNPAPVVPLPVAIPVRATTCTGTGYFVGDGSSGTPANRVVTLVPGNYDTVELQNNGTLRLSSAGTYNFKTLYLNGSIQLVAPSGRYDINVCTTFTMGNNGKILNSGGAVLTDPTRFTLYVNGSNVHMDTNVEFVGVLMAPNANFYKSTGGSINGAIWAKAINTIEPNNTIAGMSKSACQALGIAGTSAAAGICPISNTTPAVPAAIKEPCSTGRDCQMNRHCVEPKTGGTCAHSKCMEGAALSAGCDECVDRICAADSSCCGDSWSADCVAKVATVCDATCGTPAGCAHQLCSIGTPLSASCSSCSATVCAARPSCCTDAWDPSCVDLTHSLCGTPLLVDSAPGGSVCDYAAYGKGAIAVLGSGSSAALQANVKGGKIGGESLGSMAVTYANVTDDIYSAGAFAVQYSTVGGMLLQGVTVPPLVFSSTTGGVQYPVVTPQPSRPFKLFSCSASDGTPTQGVIAPGNYGAVTVAAGKTLTLQAGTYSFTSLTLANQSGANVATLALPSSGRVSIRACSPLFTAVSFGIGSKMSGLTAATAMNLDIYAQGAVVATAAKPLYGFINSDLNVKLEQSSTLLGMAISGNTVNVLGPSTIDATGLRRSCIESGFDTTRKSPPSSPQRLCAYGAWGTTETTGAGLNQIKGGDMGGGTVNFVAGVFRNEIHGSVISRTTAALPSALVLGDLRALGAVSGTPLVVGTPSATPVPDPTMPTVPTFTCPTGGLDKTGTTSLAPGVYGNLDLYWGQNLTFTAPGKYYFNRVNLDQVNQITLPATGVVEVFACSEVKFGPGLSILNLLGVGTEPLRFRVRSMSTKSSDTDPAIYVNGGLLAPVNAVLIAPQGKITIGLASRLNGLAWGKQVRLLAGASIDGAETTGSACETAKLDVGPACPVSVASPTPPSESATCGQNVTGWQESSCVGYDLAADVPCGNQIPVCNHGSSAFSGSVRVGYWAQSARHMSEITPPTPTGSCTGTLNVPAGMCATLTCASPLPSGPLTMMVDPENVLTECDGRRLDNWTVHDGRSCGSSSLVHEYDYEAVCTLPGTSPRWGLLTWNGEIPGSSSIEFAARVGTSASDAGQRSFATLVSAGSALADCGPGGPSSCPLDLTEKMSLSASQGSHLDLRITLKPQATDTPLLEDWKVTYSCVYDQ